MTYKILLTPEAESDIDDIYHYILTRFIAPQAAENTLKNIKQSIITIADYPNIGIDVSRRIGRTFSKKHNLKMTIAGNYLIFYIFADETIVILRVLYQKQNWIQLFK